jgi:DNA-binding beta-propeller fold protein YncE
VFAGLTSTSPDKPSGIGVLEAKDGALQLRQVFPMSSHPLGLCQTHDGKLLIAAAADYVVVFDEDRLIAGQPNARMGVLSMGHGDGAIYVKITDDDRTLFVSDEWKQTIAVIDFGRFAAQGFRGDALVGRIPVGSSPVALAFSADQRLLYTTSEVAADSWGWPKTVLHENPPTGRKDAEGAVVVIDVAKARLSPASSVVSRVPAGGSPVRLALSPRGDRLYVSARNSDALLVFDTANLVSDPAHSRLASARVGASPVPVALLADGQLAVVGNSDRFNQGKRSSLTVVDTARMLAGKKSFLGDFPCGAYPREFCLSPNGRTLYLTNYQASTIEAYPVGQFEQLLDSKPGHSDP